ncbi:MAG: hypothetical protein QNJ11_20010 [Woeseiaceae bacterium]|nr:hypothetical protein [Woeseiaceae bacterium]
MSFERMFTDEELAYLQMSGAERVAADLKSGDRDKAKATFSYVLSLRKEEYVLYQGWMTSSVLFIGDKYGHAAARDLMAFEELYGNYGGWRGLDTPKIHTMMNEPDSVFGGMVDKGDIDGAYEFYLEVERGARDLHDFYRDQCTVMVTKIYEKWGVDVLDEALRWAYDKDWLPWYESVSAMPAKERIAKVLDFYSVANFGNITATEHEDRIHFTQDPCGSCGRQQRAGMSEAPWNFATIKEAHELSYNMGGNSVFRTHVAMMHHILPIETQGGPWPHKQCPRSAFGVCEVDVYKDDPWHPVDAEAIRWSD